MGRVAKVPTKKVASGHKLFKLPVWIDPDNNSLQLERNIYPLSEIKDYLLRNCEDLTNKYRLRVVWRGEKARIFYEWEGIISEAYEKQIIPYDKTIQNAEKPLSRISHFILTGEDC